MLTKYCPGCNHYKPASEFKGYNGSPRKRCLACRTHDSAYRDAMKGKTADHDIGRLKTIECSVCHGKTVARTPEAPTLLGWREINFNEGRGICYEHR
jgi:hypothetical protein